MRNTRVQTFFLTYLWGGYIQVQNLKYAFLTNEKHKDKNISVFPGSSIKGQKLFSTLLCSMPYVINIDWSDVLVVKFCRMSIITWYVNLCCLKKTVSVENFALRWSVSHFWLNWRWLLVHLCLSVPLDEHVFIWLCRWIHRSMINSEERWIRPVGAFVWQKKTKINQPIAWLTYLLGTFAFSWPFRWV